LSSGEVNGANVAFVQGTMPPVSPPEGGTGAEVVVSEWTPDALTLDVSHSGEGLLVVSQVYSEGWEATVDGEEVDILQTDHALLGIPVGSGQHTVELRYQPDSLTLGLWISGVSGLGSIAVLVWSGWSGMRRHTDDDIAGDDGGGR
jgi:hypothetical protein